MTDSRSWIAATNASSGTGALDLHAAASAAGTTPIAACASVANSSTSNQRPNFETSDQIAVISGVEYRGIMTALCELTSR